MELPMARVRYRFPEEMELPENPMIRHLEIADRYDFKSPRRDVEAGAWAVANPKNLPSFSAVGYFFAKELLETQGVPIGLINAAVGGSPVQAWMSEAALKSFPSELEEARLWADDGRIAATEAHDRALSGEWFKDLYERDPGVIGSQYVWADPLTDTTSWQRIQLPGNFAQGGLKAAPGVIWLKRTFELSEEQAASDALLWLGRIVDADKVFLNGAWIGEVTYQYPPRIYSVDARLLKAGNNTLMVRVVANGTDGRFIKDKPYYLQTATGHLNLEGEWLAKQVVMDRPAPGQTFIRWKPMGLFNAMIAPLTPFAIKGVIWYQGESNTSRMPEAYESMFECMVLDWRQQWQGGQDFPFLSVQLANLGEPRALPGEDNWAVLREQQADATRIPNTAMAVSYDVGEWNDIHPLDKKTVGQRLALAARAIAYGEASVVYQGPRYAGHANIGDRIHIRFEGAEGGLQTRCGGPVGGFAVAGADGVFHWAQATVAAPDTIVISSEVVKEPRHVRYAWAQNPDRANVINRYGLPMIPFRTDR
jgi:sialate O-acetylesterase